MSLMDLFDNQPEVSVPAAAPTTNSIRQPDHSVQPESIQIPFVTTSLQIRLIETETTLQCIREGQQSYYRLTPPYFAWLERKLNAARHAQQSGKIPDSVIRTITSRFDRVREYAIQLFGADLLQQAIATFDPRNFRFPTDQDTEWRFPGHGNWAFTQPVSFMALEQVHVIRDRALAAGWTEARLYQNRGRFSFPCGEEYGVVCFLGDGRTVTDVTRRHIEIVGSPPSRAITRFYNPDVPQPWVKKIEPEITGIEAGVEQKAA